MTNEHPINLGEAGRRATDGAEGDYRFLALVMSLATAAWAQLGKVAHPVTQKVQRDMEQAKVTIDFLRMLSEKTQGNLQPKEKEMLTNVVADLEMNFADEISKSGGKGEKPGQGPEIIIPSGAGTQGPEIIKP